MIFFSAEEYIPVVERAEFIADGIHPERDFKGVPRLAGLIPGNYLHQRAQ